MNELTYVQKNFINYIEQIMQADRLSHAYLIELGDFSLEFPFVLMFVKMILCPAKIYQYHQLNCDKCNICHQIDENCFPDLQIVETDGNQIKKGQLLSLKAEYQNTSLIGKRRIYIIKDAEKLNSSSANTILKFLEEPEDGIIAVLLTKNRYQVLDTILSRCQILSLVDDIKCEPMEEKSLFLLKYLVNPEELFIHYKDIYENILTDKNVAKGYFSLLEQRFVKYLSMKFRGIIDEELSILDDVEQCKIIAYITIIEEEIPKLSYNINYKLWLNNIYSRFVEVK